jgi:hypothetical protein
VSRTKESLDAIAADKVLAFVVLMRCPCNGVASGFAVCACGGHGVLERTLTVAELRALIGGE